VWKAWQVFGSILSSVIENLCVGKENLEREGNEKDILYTRF
jgi:hypothetical protein